MVRIFIFILGYIIVTSCCYAESAKVEFNYQRKPIRPNCIASVLGTMAEDPSIKKTALLSQCTKQAKGDPCYEGEGWLYSYYPETSYPAESYLPKTGYKVFLQSKNSYLIGIRQWGGGSGQFGSIVLLRRDKDKLMMTEVLDSGDRCNGGLSYQGTKNGTLYFSSNLTAIDIFRYAPKIKIGLRPYDDIDACAACCYAQANYSYRIGDQEPKFLSITLNDKAIENPKSLAKIRKYQYCMNRVYNSYVQKHKTKLIGKQIYGFVKEFKDNCLKKRHNKG